MECELLNKLLDFLKSIILIFKIYFVIFVAVFLLLINTPMMLVLLVPTVFIITVIFKILFWSVNLYIIKMIFAFIIIPGILLHFLKIIYRHLSKSSYIMSISDKNDDKIQKTTFENYLSELNTRFKNLKCNSNTLENLVLEISKEHSAIYLQFYLTRFKQRLSTKFTDSKNISSMAFFLSICSLFLGFYSNFKDDISKIYVIRFIMSIICFIFCFSIYQVITKKPKQLANAIFLLEEALKLKDKDQPNHSSQSTENVDK